MARVLRRPVCVLVEKPTVVLAAPVTFVAVPVSNLDAAGLVAVGLVLVVVPMQRRLVVARRKQKLRV